MCQASFLPELKSRESGDKKEKPLFFHQGDHLIIRGYGVGYLTSENLLVKRLGEKGHPFYINLSSFSVYYDSKKTDLAGRWIIKSSVKPHLRPFNKDKSIRT